MTVTVTISNNSEEHGHVCRVRQHRQSVAGDIMTDVSPPVILPRGRSLTLHLVTGSHGSRDLAVVEEGGADMRFLTEPPSPREGE